MLLDLHKTILRKKFTGQNKEKNDSLRRQIELLEAEGFTKFEKIYE